MLIATILVFVGLMAKGLLYYFDIRTRQPLQRQPTANEYHQFLDDGFLRIGTLAYGLCWVINGRTYPIETDEEIAKLSSSSGVACYQDDIMKSLGESSEINGIDLAD